MCGFRIAADVEAVRVVEDFRVAIGRTHHGQDYFAEVRDRARREGLRDQRAQFRVARRIHEDHLLGRSMREPNDR